MLIGLCGDKSAGKDTFAKYVERAASAAGRSFKRVAFADRLKELCADIYGLDIQQFHDPVEKERDLNVPIDIDAGAVLLSAAIGEVVPMLGLYATTPRELLQYVGTDYVRQVCPTYWVDYVVQQCDELLKAGYIVAVTDARFDNEAEVVHGFEDSCVIRILREGARKSGGHASEAGISEHLVTLNLCGREHAEPLRDNVLFRRAAESLVSGLIPFGLDYYDYLDSKLMAQYYESDAHS